MKMLIFSTFATALMLLTSLSYADSVNVDITINNFSGAQSYTLSNVTIPDGWNGNFPSVSANGGSSTITVDMDKKEGVAQAQYSSDKGRRGEGVDYEYNVTLSVDSSGQPKLTCKAYTGSCQVSGYTIEFDQ